MQLLVAARKAEAEVGDSRTGTVTIKAKAGTTNDELVSLNDNKNRKTQTFGTNGHFNNIESSKINQSTQPLGAQSA